MKNKIYRSQTTSSHLDIFESNSLGLYFKLSVSLFLRKIISSNLLLVCSNSVFDFLIILHFVFEVFSIHNLKLVKWVPKLKFYITSLNSLFSILL